MKAIKTFEVKDTCYRIKDSFFDEFGNRWLRFERQSDGSVWFVWDKWFWIGELMLDSQLINSELIYVRYGRYQPRIAVGF